MDNYFSKNSPGSKYDKTTNQRGLKGELLQKRNKFSNKNPFGFLLNLADKGNSAALNLEDNFADHRYYIGNLLVGLYQK